jgi:hypothetical protein
MIAARLAIILCGGTLTVTIHGNDRGASPSHGPVHDLYSYVASELQARVEKAETAAGVNIAPWLREMVRQIAVENFPARWQETRLEGHYHDSHTYGTRFMLRLDEPSQTKLQQLVKHFGISKAEIIRQLIAQANDEDFPTSWQIRAAEHRVQTRSMEL